MRLAATAAAAAASAAACDSPRIRKFPPPTPFTVSNASSHRNSPSIVGTRQYRFPPSSLLICHPSPKYRSWPPTLIERPGSPVRPLKHAVVAHVSTHCATRFTTAFWSPSRLNPKNSSARPGRPSGVSVAASSRSMPASASHPMTLAAYPVAACPAVRAHPIVSAVTMTRVAVIGNASANVSSTGTELTVRTVAGLGSSRGRGD